MKFKKENLLLYAITDSSSSAPDLLYQKVETAILGGATMIQLREKHRDKAEMVAISREIKALCAKHHIPLIINDSVEIALLSDADGVHLGQSDMALSEARKRLGPDKIIGISARTVEQAVNADQNGADYLGCGAVFSTATKSDASALPYPVLQEICRSVKIPVVAIGGIKEENMLRLAGSGIDGVAVVSALFGAADIRSAAQKLHALAKQTTAKEDQEI